MAIGHNLRITVKFLETGGKVLQGDMNRAFEAVQLKLPGFPNVEKKEFFALFKPFLYCLRRYLKGWVG